MWFLPWVISSLNKKPEKIVLGKNHKKLILADFQPKIKFWEIMGSKKFFYSWYEYCSLCINGLNNS
ncbi:MAG TPA: hypothetical protein DDZ97_09535 [Deltaproteobacteria bacterium]|nr:hypothetical protein [Deltaproteobacteria bacterium]